MPVAALPEIRLAAAPAEADANVLAVPLFESDALDSLSQVDEASGGALSRAVAAREATGAPYEQWWCHSVPSAGWRIPRVLVEGAGNRERWTLDAARRWAAAVTMAARQRRHGSIALLMNDVADVSTARLVQALVEGVALAHHDVGHLKSAPPDLPRVQQVTLVGAHGNEDVSDAVHRGLVLGACTNLARSLGNEPSNVLTPRELATRA